MAVGGGHATAAAADVVVRQQRCGGWHGCGGVRGRHKYAKKLMGKRKQTWTRRVDQDGIA